MSRHVLVAMGPNDAPENALTHALENYPDARISVINVTDTSDPLDLFGDRDPGEYVVPDREFELDEGLMPEDSFTGGQRRRAEYAFDRACTLSDAYTKEIEPVMKSGEPVEEIVTYTEERGVDRIVIADHPRTELRPLVRTVPESAVRNASTPVTRPC